MAAAGVAGAAVVTSLVGSRWALRGALRGAEETARAGLAQADSSYRAALHTAREQAQNDHLQWRRGIQRDAYVAFLNAVLVYAEYGDSIPRATGQTDELDRRFAASSALIADLKNKYLVVELEGPEEVSSAAKTLHEATLARVRDLEDWTRYTHAHALLDRERESHRAEYGRIRSLMPTARLIRGATGEIPQEVTDALDEYRTLLASIGLSDLVLPLLWTTDFERTTALGNEYEGAVSSFLNAARTTLSASGRPA